MKIASCRRSLRWTAFTGEIPMHGFGKVTVIANVSHSHERFRKFDLVSVALKISMHHVLIYLAHELTKMI